jgi:O-antigen/teichoic acid export membrane protein
LGRFWIFVVGVFVTPFIIKCIGIERFGVWAIIGVITGYFSLFDFGVGSSFVKYLSEYYTRKEYDKINQVINTGLVFYSFFGIGVIGVTFVFIDQLLVLFKVSAALYGETKFVVLAGIVLFTCNNALSSFSSLQSGLQRMDVTNKIAIGMSLINVTGILTFLSLGYGLAGLMVNNIILFCIVTIVNIAVAFRLVPSLRLGVRFVNRRMLAQLFNIGYRVQMTKVAGVITTQTDKILIGYFLSLGLVTYYQLGSGIVGAVMGFSYMLVSALIPAFAEIEARGERVKLIEAYLMTTKYLAFFMVPLFIFVIISAFHIIR